jgi:hypothetical protein
MEYRALTRMVRPKREQVTGELTNITKIYDAVLRKGRRDWKTTAKKQAATERPSGNEKILKAESLNHTM